MLPFVDEFYLFYTSLRKVLQAHGGYLYGIRKINYANAPSFVVFIGDLYPTIEKDFPADIDSINNTVQNYLFNDKSKR